MAENRLRTVAYARVSTKEQPISLDSQIRHFNDIMDNTPTMVNCGCYVDNGISGRFMQRREGFLQMLDDCELHKIDLILCKSIKRFGRCTLDTIKAIERLRELGIAVYFEQEGIDTIKDRNNILLVTMAQVAQEEYEDRSEAVRWAFKRRFEQGKLIANPNTPYGYKLNKEGELEIVPEEAKIVKRIFEEYASTGRSNEICLKLNRQGHRTAHGRLFQASTILYMIKNEKYKGDAMMEKKVIINGRQVKNTGQLMRYYVEDHHEPIVSKELWDKANARRALNQKNPNVFKPIGHDPMSKMIVCGKCGHHFIRSFRNAQKYRYICNGHDDVTFRKCTNPSVRRETLEMVFVQIFNDLRGKKLTLEELPLSEELVEVNAEKERLLVQEKTYLQLQARGLLEGALEDEYRHLLKNIVLIEDKRKELLSTNAQNVQSENELRAYNKAIMRRQPLTEFDEELFRAVVKKIIIYGRENFEFQLTSGKAAIVKIIYYGNKEDEIDSITYESKEEGKQ